jgi:uncharacterized protein (DUF427 family)
MQIIIKARESGAVIAAGEINRDVQYLEGNWYFTPEAVAMSALQISDRTYFCPYKGTCYWVDLITPEGMARSVGWVYPQPKDGYEFIRDRIAFYGRDTAATLSVTRTQDTSEPQT